MLSFRRLAVAVIVSAACVGVTSPAFALLRPADGEAALVAPGSTSNPPATADTTDPAVIINSLDLHDGTLVHAAGHWYLYGTRYNCGFIWGKNNSPWCGFGVSEANSLTGPWTRPKLLFSPKSQVANSGTWKAEAKWTWQEVCDSDTGQGCFNPRMLVRPDGTWILWFNTASDTIRSGVNGYWAMRCKGPMGPCGAGTGQQDVTVKPTLSQCNAHGDFSILTSGAQAAIVCSTGGIYSHLAEELLNPNWVNGTGKGSSNLLAAPSGGTTATGFSSVEGVGGYQQADGSWELTFSDPGCGYCSGTKAVSGPTDVDAGFATAPSMLGPWTFGGLLSSQPCDGQPRTVTAGGYEWVDRWTATRNETQASIMLEPMDSSSWSCD